MKMTASELFFKLPQKPDRCKDKISEKTSKHCNFLYVHFNLMYYFLLSPFRLEKVGNGRQNCFSLHSWLPQQILFVFTAFLGIFETLSLLRLSLLQIQIHNPISFFNVFGLICLFLLRLVVFSGFWGKQEKYLKLANYLANYNSGLPFNPSTSFLLCFHLHFVLRGFQSFFVGHGVINSEDWSSSWIYRKYVERARVLFFIEDQIGNATSAPELSTFTGSDHFITGVYFYSRLASCLMWRLVHVYLLMYIFTLWAPACAFSKEISQRLEVITGNRKNKFGVEFNSAFNEFNALAKLSFLIREAMGDAVTPFLAKILFDYAITIDDIFLPQGLSEKIGLLSNYASVLAILFFSAEIVRKMDLFKTWLYLESGRATVIDQNQLGLILQAMQDKTVGINAAGMFAINYPFLGTFAGVAMTYFIIRLQSVPDN